MIVFENVTKAYGSTKALDGISFRIEPGEFVFIKGPSGAGKTTLARLLLKEIEPTEGEITVGEFVLSKLKNRELPLYRQQIGEVFQDFKLLNERTAAENIALALEIMNKSDAVIEATVNELLKVMGLTGKGHLFPRQLSGGEVQRVVIARAMATEPAVLFADEPTGNLDAETAWQIVELLERINEAGTTVIMSTHNHDIVAKLKKRTLELKDGKLVDDTKKAAHEPHKKKTHHKKAEEEMPGEDLVKNAVEPKEEHVPSDE